MKPNRVVITGGPGTGKTVIIEELEKRGYFCLHEIIRSMTLAAKKEGDPNTFVSNPLAFVSDPFRFNERILRGRVAQFEEAAGMKESIVFFDRGLPDVLAYMNYFQQPYPKAFEETCQKYIYDKVILLPPWEEIYVSDNERLESFEEALEIHEHLDASYKEFGYDPIVLAPASIKQRTDFILQELKLDND